MTPEQLDAKLRRMGHPGVDPFSQHLIEEVDAVRYAIRTIDQQAAEISRLRASHDQLHLQCSTQWAERSNEINRLRTAIAEARRLVDAMLECNKGEDSQGRHVYRLQPGMMLKLAATLDGN